jgi:hypothetical protein
MNNKFNLDIPSKSISYMLICGGIIIIIILIGIIPLNRYSAKRSQDVKAIQGQIDEQKAYAQAYQFIQSTSNKKVSYILPNPAPTKLSRQDWEKFQFAFRAETGKSGMMVSSLAPDTKSLEGGSQKLLYNATVKGEFANFRKLLVALGALPYNDRIDEINMKQNSDSMEFKVKIWIALAN